MFFRSPVFLSDLGSANIGRSLRINPLTLQILASSFDISEERLYMKATGIVRRVDDLGRIVIPKEIRRTLRIREGDPLLKTLTVNERYLWAMKLLHKRIRES